MMRPLPRLQAVGLTAASLAAVALLLLLIHWLTESRAATPPMEEVRLPWLALLAPLLPWLLRNAAIGRIDLPGLNEVGAAYGALLKLISSPISGWVAAAWAPKVGLAVQNGLTYILFPVLLSLLFGIRFGLKGLTWRSFWVGWVLALPMILVNLVEWGTQAGSFREDLISLFTNPFMNGYGEEMMHNGLIMPRLVQITKNPALGICLSAIFFGAIHFWTNRPNFPDAWSTLASCFIAQAPMGLLFGYLAYRLRSLLAGSILHVWMDT